MTHRDGTPKRRSQQWVLAHKHHGHRAPDAPLRPPGTEEPCRPSGDRRPCRRCCRTRWWGCVGRRSGHGSVSQVWHLDCAADPAAADQPL